MITNINKVFESADYKLKDADRVAQIFDTWKRDGTLTDVEAAIKQAIKEKNAIATGDLINSVKVEVSVDGYTYRVIFSARDYFDYVDRGRAPGKYPPPPAIEKWIKVKPVTPYADRSGRIPTIRQLTFLICRKIWREGIEPRNFSAVLEVQSMELKNNFETKIRAL